MKKTGGAVIAGQSPQWMPKATPFERGSVASWPSAGRMPSRVMPGPALDSALRAFGAPVERAQSNMRDVFQGWFDQGSADGRQTGFRALTQEPVRHIDDPRNLPLDRVSSQPSAMTNGNALPAYQLPSWASDSGDDPEGLASKRTYFNVPEQMSPFLRPSATYGVLPGTILSAEDMEAVKAGRTIPAQIMTQLQIERMNAGGPLAGHADLDGDYLRRYLDQVAGLNGTQKPPPAPAPRADDVQSLVSLLQGVPQPAPDFDYSHIYNGWQY